MPPPHLQQLNPMDFAGAVPQQQQQLSSLEFVQRQQQLMQHHAMDFAGVVPQQQFSSLEFVQRQQQLMQQHAMLMQRQAMPPAGFPLTAGSLPFAYPFPFMPMGHPVPQVRAANPSVSLSMSLNSCCAAP